MSCNTSKCKEFVFNKKGVDKNYINNIASIPKFNNITILGLEFEGNCRFSMHVKNKLLKSNTCLHILRCLRKEGYNQKELDHLFNSLVLPIVTYGLPVYAAATAELTTVQAFPFSCSILHK